MPTFVRTQEIEHRIGPDGQLSLRLTSPDVELRGVDGDTARVRIEFEVRAPSEAEADEAFDRMQFSVDRGDGRLEVSEPRRGSEGLASIASILGLGSSRWEASVVAEVPRRTAVRFNGVSGDLTARGLIGPQGYRTVSGDLVLSGLAGSVDVNGVSSDVSLRADAPVSLRATTVSGDLSIFAPRLDEARVTTVSGDVELEGHLAPEGSHRVETVSGDLSLGIVGGLTLEVRGLSSEVHVQLPHRSEGSRDRRRYVIGDGSVRLQFSSMSGDASVHAPRRMAASPTPPTPPTPPTAPTPPAPATMATAPTPAARTISETEQLEVLRALERGEIDVDEATRRLGGAADA
jgi:hypothetical protein